MLKSLSKLDFTGSDPDPITAYTLAKQEWHGVVGTAVKQKKEWKTIALILAGGLILSVMGNIYLSNKSSVVPYVIEVDTSTGGKTITKLDRAKESTYIPTEAVIRSQIASFIQDIEAISTDQIVIQDNLLKGYDMVTRKGYDLLTAYIREQRKPFELSGKKAVTIESIVINKITNTSYQAEWTENHYSIGSQKEPDKIEFLGTFTTKIDPPKTEEKLLKNPLGINIDEFHIAIKYKGN
jgi:type IV secretion system protein VirB5